MKYLTVALLLTAFLFLPNYVLAADHPDSTPTLDNIYVNRNLIETGDMLFLAVYNIPYASTPDERVDQLFVFRLIDTDGVTELGSNEAYSYVNNGIGQGLVSFYFDSSDAPTWGNNYYIRISEKASEFAEPQHWNFIIPDAAYTSQTAQDDNRDELITRLISISTTLETDWGASYDLLTETDTGTVLSDQGETYFRNSIYGLQAMCPKMFLTIVVDPDYTALQTTWAGTQADTYEGRLTGTQPGLATQAWADIFSVDFNLIAGIPVLLACLGCIIISHKLSNQAWSGMLCCVAILVTSFALGWVPRGIIAMGTLLCAFLLVGLTVKRFLPA